MFVCLSGDYAKKKTKKKLLNGFSRPGRGPTEPFQLCPRSRRQNGSNHVLSTSLILPGCHSLFSTCDRGNNDQQHDVRQASLSLVSEHCELFRADPKKKNKATICMRKKVLTWLLCNNHSKPTTIANTKKNEKINKREDEKKKLSQIVCQLLKSVDSVANTLPTD